MCWVRMLEKGILKLVKDILVLASTAVVLCIEKCAAIGYSIPTLHQNWKLVIPTMPTYGGKVA